MSSRQQSRDSHDDLSEELQAILDKTVADLHKRLVRFIAKRDKATVRRVKTEQKEADRGRKNRRQRHSHSDSDDSDDE